MDSYISGTNTRSESSLDKGEPESELNGFLTGKSKYDNNDDIF